MKKVLWRFLMIIRTVWGRNPLEFTGDYPSWQAAEAAAGGYAASHILEKCSAALMKVKNGEASYERDSVIFDRIQYSWPLLSGLLRAALANDGEVHVLDFGGSLGSTYFQNRIFLKGLKVHWHIVEQPHFVEHGKVHFEDDVLQFSYSVEEALEKDPRINVCILSSVLPYLPEPRTVIRQVKNAGFDYIIVDRTLFIEGSRERIVVQHVPEHIYKGSYPARFFVESQFIEAFQPEYSVLADFDSYLNAAAYLKDGMGHERGMIFQRSK